MTNEGMIVDGAWVTKRDDEEKWEKNLALFYQWTTSHDLDTGEAPSRAQARERKHLSRRPGPHSQKGLA